MWLVTVLNFEFLSSATTVEYQLRRQLWYREKRPHETAGYFSFSWSNFFSMKWYFLYTKSLTELISCRFWKLTSLKVWNRSLWVNAFESSIDESLLLFKRGTVSDHIVKKNSHKQNYRELQQSSSELFFGKSFKTKSTSFKLLWSISKDSRHSVASPIHRDLMASVGNVDFGKTLGNFLWISALIHIWVSEMDLFSWLFSFRKTHNAKNFALFSATNQHVNLRSQHQFSYIARRKEISRVCCSITEQFSLRWNQLYKFLAVSGWRVSSRLKTGKVSFRRSVDECEKAP